MSSLFRRSQNIEKKRVDLANLVLQYREKYTQSSSQSPTSSGSSRPYTSTTKLFKRKSQTLETVERPPPAQEPKEPPAVYDVAIVGAGPGGLMLAANLVRYGINVIVIDNRSKGLVGRADTVQPKTIETFRQMRLADQLLLKGTKIHDMRYWSGTSSEPLRHRKRDVLFPCDQVDTPDPYLLNAHQSLVEELLLKDIMERGWDVTHNLTFIDYEPIHNSNLLSVICSSTTTHQKVVIQTRHLIGCDGVHSTVRKLMASRHIASGGSSSHGIWAVMDCTITTDFPDLYSKTIIHNEEAGAMIIEPRERNSTRLYVQMQTHIEDFLSKIDLSEKAVFDRVREVLVPFTFSCNLLESAGCYQVARKTSTIFADPTQRVFLVGDAAFSASPMAYGMNIALASAVNLAWKLNLSLRGLAAPSLLATYSTERKAVASLQADADADELDALTCGSSAIYAENALRHARWAAGYAADYAPDGLVSVVYPGSEMRGELRVGGSMPPGKVTRWIDAAPVDLQVDIPLLGTFKMYFFCKSLWSSREYLEIVVSHCFIGDSVIGRANRKAEASYSAQPPVEATSDDWVRPERYTVVSGLFTFGLILETSVDNIDSADLPNLWKNSSWTVYADDVPHLDTRGMGCIEKYLGGISATEVAMVVVRPDNYIGTIVRGRGSKENAQKACSQLDGYFGGFLNA